jgi:hypothetical protein
MYSKLQKANFSVTPKSILLSINQELYRRTYLIVKGPEVHLFCCDSCICGQVHGKKGAMIFKSPKVRCAFPTLLVFLNLF